MKKNKNRKWPTKRQRWLKRRKRWLADIYSRRKRYVAEANLCSAFKLLVMCIVAWLLLPSFAGPMWQDYQVALGGLILDILFILIIFEFFRSGDRRRHDIKRQQEVIEDYKQWDSEEARFRLAGAFRRLNRLGETKFDLAGLQLSNFRFWEHDIKSLASSVFYDGTWRAFHVTKAVMLQDVFFDGVACTNAIFSSCHPLKGLRVTNRTTHIINCSFVDANLERARFDEATISWANEPPEDLFEYLPDESAPDGFYHTQVHRSPFDGANLKGASFRRVRFENADFRGSIDVAFADFTHAEGLETCVFDEEARQNETLEGTALRTG